MTPRDPITGPADEDELLLRLDRESAQKTERVRALLLAEGRPDLVADLVARLRDIRLGLDAARNCWHSISSAQRRVLLLLAEGRVLVRPPHSRTRCHAIGPPHALGDVCSIATARALCKHELLACDGVLLDPERRMVLTERGRFVVRHGPTEAAERLGR